MGIGPDHDVTHGKKMHAKKPTTKYLRAKKNKAMRRGSGAAGAERNGAERSGAESGGGADPEHRLVRGRSEAETEIFFALGGSGGLFSVFRP